jgi:hypothetical protein
LVIIRFIKQLCQYIIYFQKIGKDIFKSFIIFIIFRYLINRRSESITYIKPFIQVIITNVSQAMDHPVRLSEVIKLLLY